MWINQYLLESLKICETRFWMIQIIIQGEMVCISRKGCHSRVFLHSYHKKEIHTIRHHSKDKLPYQRKLILDQNKLEEECLRIKENSLHLPTILSTQKKRNR